MGITCHVDHAVFDCQRLEGAWPYFVCLIDHSAGLLLGTCRLFHRRLLYIVVCYCFYYKIDLGFGQNTYPRWPKESRASSRWERVYTEGARLVLSVLGSRFSVSWRCVFREGALDD